MRVARRVEMHGPSLDAGHQEMLHGIEADQATRHPRPAPLPVAPGSPPAGTGDGSGGAWSRAPGLFSSSGRWCSGSWMTSPRIGERRWRTTISALPDPVDTAPHHDLLAGVPRRRRVVHRWRTRAVDETWPGMCSRDSKGTAGRSFRTGRPCIFGIGAVPSSPGPRPCRTGRSGRGTDNAIAGG